MEAGSLEGAAAALQVREDGDLHQKDSNGNGTIGKICLKMELTGFADGLEIRVRDKVKGDSWVSGVVKWSCHSLSWGAPCEGRFVEENQELSLGQVELDMHDGSQGRDAQEATARTHDLGLRRKVRTWVRSPGE